MKKFLSLLACLVVVFTLTACGAKGEAGKPIDAIKKFDVTQIEKYYGSKALNDLLKGSNEDVTKVDKKDPVVKILISKLSYKVIEANESEDKSSITCKAEITNVPVAAIYAKYVLELGKLQLGHLSATDKEKEKWPAQAYEAAMSGASTNTDTVTYTLVKQDDGSYKVDAIGQGAIFSAILI